MRTLIATFAAALLIAAPAHAVPAGSTVLVDRPSGFGPLPYDGASYTEVGWHALSADGCMIVYTSGSDALLATDDDSADNVYRQNRCAPGSPPLQVNRTAAGVPAEAWSSSYMPTISADGRFVAFLSNARNLHPDARGAEQYVYVKDLETGAIELASRGNGASGAPSVLPDQPVISGDGGSVAFMAFGPLDAQGSEDGVDGATNAYLRSLGSDVTRMVSITYGGARGNGVVEDGNSLDVDHAGRNVVFISEYRLTINDPDDGWDAFVRRGIGTSGEATELVSFTSGQTAGADEAYEVAISGDAKRIAWTNGRVFSTSCNPCKPATRVDRPRPNGSNDSADHERPFFAQTGGAPAASLFWQTSNPLDPGDADGADDIYAASAVLDPGDPVRSVTGFDARDVEGASAVDAMLPVVFGVEAAIGLPGADGVHDQAYLRTGGELRHLAELGGLELRTSEAGFGEPGSQRAVSDDGRVVVFTTYAPALGAPLEDDERDPVVAARDVVTGTTVPVSVGLGGTPPNARSSGGSVDAAGRRVAFTSSATNLVEGVTEREVHVYVRDLATGTTRLVDRRPDGRPVKYGSSGGTAMISGDGTKVVFVSYSPDLPGAGGGRLHVYRADLSTGAIQLVDRANDGTPGDGYATEADISSDGNRIAFTSGAKNLGGPSDPQEEIYVRDMAAGTTEWVSVPEAPPAQRPRANSPSVSGDGRRVAFVVAGAGFGHGAVDLDTRVFVRDLTTRTTTLASPGGPEEAEDEYPSLSRDGTRVAFARFPDLAFGRTLVRDLASGTLIRADLRDGTDAPGRLGGSYASLSGNGACVAFRSWSDDLVTPSPGPDFAHAYLRALGDCPARPGGGQGGAVADTRAPVISRARVTNRRFVPARGRTARAARVKRGTAFVFRLSEAARTTIVIERRRKRRFAKVVTLTRTRTLAGANRVAFTGRVGRRALKRGVYRARLVATDAAGNRSRPVGLTFRVQAARAAPSSARPAMPSLR